MAGGRRRERVGFIGLGIMGKPMALNLLRAGIALTVHSRSRRPVDELAAAGASTAASPAAVADASDVVVTMLPDTPDVELVLLGESGVADRGRDGMLVIDMSTIDPIATRRFAEGLAERGIDLVDAPVSGGDVGARDGTLSIMVGGTDDAVARAMPLFEVMGSTVVHIGPSGAGQVAKACNQFIAATTIQMVAEALTFARRAGVDPARVRAALLGGFANSRILELHGQRMLDRDFRPGFRSALLGKDLRIVRQTAAQVGASVSSSDAVTAALDRLLEAGGGDLDPSALVTLLDEATAGPPDGPV